jgi:hypothetical protein
LQFLNASTVHDKINQLIKRADGIVTPAPFDPLASVTVSNLPVFGVFML